MNQYIKSMSIVAGIFIMVCIIAYFADKVLEKNFQKAPPPHGNCFVEQNYGKALQWEGVQKKNPPLKIMVDKECVTHIESTAEVKFDTLQSDRNQDLYLPFIAEVKGYDEVPMTVYATVENADRIRQMMSSQEGNVELILANYGVYSTKDLLIVKIFAFEKEGRVKSE